MSYGDFWQRFHLTWKSQPTNYLLKHECLSQIKAPLFTADEKQTFDQIYFYCRGLFNSRKIRNFNWTQDQNRLQSWGEIVLLVTMECFKKWAIITAVWRRVRQCYCQKRNCTPFPIQYVSNIPHFIFFQLNKVHHPSALLNVLLFAHLSALLVALVSSDFITFVFTI